MKNGILETINDVHKNFPNIEYLYYALVGYTLLYVGAIYLIYKVTSQAGKEQDVLQQQACEIVNYAERINILLSSYIRHAKSNNITDKTAEQKLKFIQRQVASLPPNVIKNASLKSNLSNVVEELQNQISPEFDYQLFCSMLDSAIDTINSLKHKSINIH